jgi:hypothetical protein
LDLFYEYSALSRLELDFPKLELLTVHTEGWFRQLPELSPTYIHWEVQEIYYDEPSEISEAFLLLSPNLQVVKFHEKLYIDMWPEIIQRRRTGDLPWLADVIMLGDGKPDVHVYLPDV